MYLEDDGDKVDTNSPRLFLQKGKISTSTSLQKEALSVRTWPHIWWSASNIRLKSRFCCSRTRPNWVRSGKQDFWIFCMYHTWIIQPISLCAYIEAFPIQFYMQFAAVTAHNPNNAIIRLSSRALEEWEGERRAIREREKG